MENELMLFGDRILCQSNDKCIACGYWCNPKGYGDGLIMVRKDGEGPKRRWFNLRSGKVFLMDKVQGANCIKMKLRDSSYKVPQDHGYRNWNDSCSFYVSADKWESDQKDLPILIGARLQYGWLRS